MWIFGLAEPRLGASVLVEEAAGRERRSKMSKNQHNAKSNDKTMNQNNQMSDDPADGSRNSFVLGKDGDTPVEKAPENDQQDQSTIEAFGQEGAGIAAKE